MPPCKSLLTQYVSERLEQLWEELIADHPDLKEERGQAVCLPLHRKLYSGAVAFAEDNSLPERHNIHKIKAGLTPKNRNCKLYEAIRRELKRFVHSFQVVDCCCSTC